MKLGSWSITRGFVQKFGTLKGGDAKDPIKALDYIAAAEGRGLFVLRDFHAFVNDPTVVRKAARSGARSAQNPEERLHFVGGDQDSA